jgi:superfamily II DNA or RNA helicase
MILDNKNEANSVYDYLERYVASGELDITVGYFTISALAWLSDIYNEKIDKFRFILGELTNKENNKITRLDLLNKEITVKEAMKIKKFAEKTVKFLKQNNVEIRTTEPDFCHAKLYLQRAIDSRNDFFISGSSNLTEAGIGRKKTSNIELNIAHYGDIPTYSELKLWFDELWKNEKVKNNKEGLIKEISKIFEPYTPNDIYLKIIAEMFSEESISEAIEMDLKNYTIYQTLFDFQKVGLSSLIQKIDNSGGAILADAVGLGKTYTALAVIKHYQLNGRKTLVIVPKKLEYNWKQYTKQGDFSNTIFKRDKFEYEVVAHTDMNEQRLIKIFDNNFDILTNDTPKLIVIDESHNFRNEKSLRYKYLMDELIKKNQNIKVLLLSATPINNSIMDVFSQIKLFGNFENERNIFKNANQTIIEWSQEENRPNINTLRNKLHHEFINKMDSLIVARTRKQVANKELVFPKLTEPENIYIEPNCIENISSTEALLNLLPDYFYVYLPAVFAELTDKNVYHDPSRRSYFLVRMMQIMIAKRLESSWFSFKKTISNILQYHKIVLNKLQNFQDIDEDDFDKLFEDEDLNDNDELSIGKKKPVPIKLIKNLDLFTNNVKNDTAKLQYIVDKLDKFSAEKDSKLNELISIINKKQQKANKKVLIFTTYKDTAKYLYDELSKHFSKIEEVSGASNKIVDILKRFSPKSNNVNEKQISNPIDILVSTDVLSVGQNLQDCDCVINYDIHWNPVSIIQRVGRIDRIGSNNKEILCYNFWPSKNIDEYLNLKSRVETRMATMTIAGSEIITKLTDELDKMTKDNEFEARQNANNLRMMQNSLDEIENGTLCFSDLSLDSFKQDLTNEIREKYRNLPKGIFSGFKHSIKGLVILLENTISNEKKLIFIDENGTEIKQNQHDILTFLSTNRRANTYIPDAINECEETEIETYTNAILKWIDNSIEPEKKKLENDIFSNSFKLSNVNENTEISKQYNKENWNLICWDVISN